MIECNVFLGGKKRVPVENLVFRPTAYGIVRNDGRILLVNNRRTGKLYLPGGGVELGERLEAALKREVKEETGLDIENIQLLSLQESIFNPHYHTRRHFLYIDFSCTTTSTQVTLNEESQEFAWVALPEALNLALDPYTRALLTEYMNGKTSPYQTTILYNYKRA